MLSLCQLNCGKPNLKIVKLNLTVLQFQGVILMQKQIFIKISAQYNVNPIYQIVMHSFMYRYRKFPQLCEPINFLNCISPP